MGVVQVREPAVDEPGSIFISYRREDVGQQVLHLVRDLSPHLTADRVFYDRETLTAGDLWKEHLHEAIERSSVVLVLIGKSWLLAQNPASGRRRLDEANDWVRTEIELAIEAAANRGLVIIPLLLNGASMPDPDYLPESISALCDHQARELRSAVGEDWDSDVAALLAVITDHVATGRPADPLAIDIDATEIEAVHFANEAAQTFTVTNVSNRTQKVGLHLHVTTVEATDRLRLRKAGAVLREFELHAALDTSDSVDLLAGRAVQLVLAPGETEAFRLALQGAEGTVYTCSVVALSRDVETGAESREQSRPFSVVFPIRSIELLRDRQQERKHA